ncbi:MAG: mechanosensitive ion channel [Mobilicoccus sp.]|nr:mechanosensitive ion channel [Mobilicoccus sp.]
MTPDNPLGLPQVTGENLLYGAIALGIGWVLSFVLKRLVTQVLLWRGRGPSSAKVFGRLTSWIVLFLGVAAALTVIFPSVRPVDILGGVGVVSIAAGIAFQTVLGNGFAGIVLLARDQFRVGDQIQVEDHRGTVMAMTLSATTLQTFDGRKLIIPNSVLHSEIVTVQTGFERVRTAVLVDLDVDGDVDQACRIAVEAMTGLPEVIVDPAPQALLRKVGTGSVELELRFWSGARQLETREAQHAVIRAVVAAFREHGVERGSDSLTIEPGPVLTALVAEGVDAKGEDRTTLLRRGRVVKDETREGEGH